jgi:hypothetical protein
MRRAGQAAYHDLFLDVFGWSLKNPVITDLYPPATPYNIRQALWVWSTCGRTTGSVPRYATRRRKLAAGQGEFRICGEQECAEATLGAKKVTRASVSSETESLPECGESLQCM